MQATPQTDTWCARHGEDLFLAVGLAVLLALALAQACHPQPAPAFPHAIAGVRG